ncbi:venom carboxylesterase-6-like [Schistocerca serialis cubense]|uniref:venom carboxylesterase-6-like n=1 Tax=Schistocerca serialis cubense TaxID=2023355 RepID=UPI00214F565A|nr:venom carboxylesterase-6-like [Schistocerca serialis cubense]
MDGFCLSFGAIFVLALAASCNAQYVYATVEQGELEGELQQTILGTTYRRFIAVPFAEPPIGELRFARSRPPASWEGVRRVQRDFPVCLQVGAGSEDCLYLNVFVPHEAAANASEPLPVLVWIPGGGYEGGGGTQADFGPDFFLEHGIIVVTINYRLAAFGFLSLEDEVIPGNAGLKDQQMALQWVQRNIAAFGGDPARVTIGGESAGGCSASHHFTSPQSAGLFRGVIIQNGQSVSPWGIFPNARDMAFRLGALLGLQTNDSQELAAFLRAQEASDLVDRGNEILTDDEKLKLARLAFAPVVEPDVEDAFVREHPITVLKEGRFNKVPVLTGVDSGEGVLFIIGDGYLTDPKVLRTFNENFEVATAPDIHLPTEEERINATRKLHDFYFGEGDITLDDAQSLVDLATDQHFAEPTDSLVRYVSQLSDQPVFYYLFDYRGAHIGNTTYGSPHAAELAFIFHRNDSAVEWEPGTVEGDLTQRMVNSWSSFIKYGDPNYANDSVVWEPFSVSSTNYLHITADYELRQNTDQGRMNFWHENIPM